MRGALVNPALNPAAVPRPDTGAAAFHAALPGYRPTPVHDLPGVAAELGLGGVAVKDESDRLGLPAFKVLGASWAVERALRERPEARTLVAASAGNHGRAVAHVAAARGLYLPARRAHGGRLSPRRAPSSSSWTGAWPASTARRSRPPHGRRCAPASTGR